jgi:hypothetical protein
MPVRCNGRKKMLWCLVGAQMCAAKILATYKILALVWLLAKTLVANKKLPTYLMFSSYFLPKF